MSDLTVGPIQTYVDNSLLLSPTIDQIPEQQRVSVTLTDTNLWLVDTSKLKGQTTGSQDPYTILSLQTKYQTTVPFENVSFDAAMSAPALAGGSDSGLRALDGNSLMLAQVTGGTQMGSTSFSPSSGSGGGSTGIASSGSSGGLSSGGGSDFGGGGDFSGFGSGGSGSSSSTSGGSNSLTPVSPGSSSSSGQTTGTSQTATSQTTTAQTTTSQTTTTSSSGSTEFSVRSRPPEPVPFDASSTIGLLSVLAMFGYRVLSKKAGKLLSNTNSM